MNFKVLIPSFFILHSSFFILHAAAPSPLATAYATLETNAVEALPLFQSIVNGTPQSVEALLGLGQCLLAAQQNVSAETAYRNALLHSTTPEMRRAARVGLVHSFVATKKYAEAETTLAELISDHPEEALLRRIQGQVRNAQGNTLGARISFECARRLEDQHGNQL